MAGKKKNNTQAKVMEGVPSTELSISTPDYARYEHYINELGLSIEAKQKLIDQLWAVAVDFVALAHDQHPVQAVLASFFEDIPLDDTGLKTCGQFPEHSPEQPADTGVRAIFNPESNHTIENSKNNPVHPVSGGEDEPQHGT